jgi:hypothetical protein
MRSGFTQKYELPGDLEGMAEPFGDNEVETGDLVLQERIGADRPCASTARSSIRRRIGREWRGRRARAPPPGSTGARDLGHAHGAGFVVDADDVGKGAAMSMPIRKESRAVHPC